jgi:hypothetical protein
VVTSVISGQSRRRELVPSLSIQSRYTGKSIFGETFVLASIQGTDEVVVYASRGGCDLRVAVSLKRVAFGLYGDEMRQGCGNR